MRTPKNPFILSGYHSPKYFCNRQNELLWLEEQFLNERNAVLYAQRRMGKSALIKHFFYHLEKRKAASTVFVDLLGTSNMPQANRKIATAIVQKFGNFKGGIGQRMMVMLSSLGATIGLDPISRTPQISIGLLSAAEVEKSMEAMGSFLKDVQKPVVIAIDEFQQITQYPEINSEALFRSWTQEFPMVRFIFSGSHRQMMQTIFTDHSRPFYNSAQLLSLEVINRKDYASFSRAFFVEAKIEIEEDTLGNIFEWTRMQTYYVQLICNKLYGRGQLVTKDLLLEVQHEILNQEAPLFGTYQQLLTDFQWRALKAIALEEKVVSPTAQEFLSKHGLGAASSMSTALQLLIKKGFVIQQDGQYMLHDTLLLRWLQQL